MTGAYPIRPITEAEWAAYNDVSAQAFHNTAPPEEELARERLVFEFGRSLAAFDGTDIVGTAAIYSFRMTVPGGALPVAGVSFVSVLPTHRRRGILSAMMAHQLAGLAEGGEAVAALFASEPGIYGRFGYGLASLSTRFRIRRGDVRVSAGVAGEAAAGGPVRLRAVSVDPPAAELAKIYDQILPTRPGLLARDDRWWRSVLYDSAHWRGSHGPLRCIVAEDGNGPCGYATYSIEPSWDSDALPSARLAVRELMAADARASAALWTDLLTRDLTGEITARLRPSDDPLLHQVSDLRRIRAQLSDGLWVRVVDPGAALSRRDYSAPVDVVLEVTDDLLPANTGRWHLQATPGGAATCERTTADADLALPVTALGAAYLGGTKLAALARAGQVAELRPGRLAPVSLAFSWDPAPWCPVIF